MPNTKSNPPIETPTKVSRTLVIAVLSLVAIAVHFVLQLGVKTSGPVADAPLQFILVVGGLPMLWELLNKLWQRKFGSDLLGGISIITSVLLHEYLAGAIIVLMLAGGEALEGFALRSASSVLEALSKRLPSIAHRREATAVVDIALDAIRIDDVLEIFPHDICPTDGVVIEGRGTMDESYLTGEPFKITKTTGSTVLSGAINGESLLVVQTTKLAADSRYAKIMGVMKESEATRPQLRRLGDQLGALYTPAALGIAGLAWAMSGSTTRFLSVLVIATPCPLLIAIPVAIIGSISLCARNAIIVKSPAVLEQVAECRTAIFDKTGTLTYGEPNLTERIAATGFDSDDVLRLAASLERYSKHPLAGAILAAAQLAKLETVDVDNVSELPGKGLQGTVLGKSVQVTSRGQLKVQETPGREAVPPTASGIECVVVVDGQYAGLFRFRDAPRVESDAFVRHLGPSHHFSRVMLVSGDRKSEVQYLADSVGIAVVFAEQSPEEKLAIVRRETNAAKTLYVGDGINDAPAMMAATVGMAIGQNSDVTAEAAGVVVLDNSLTKVDEFIHISRRMRTIALQSAIGGMVLSMVGMAFAATGHLSPVHGAVIQEVIDVLAVLNALRAAFPPKRLHD